MTTNLKIGPCPKCGNTTFITTAHVTQTWLVDEDGDFIEAKSDCDGVTEENRETYFAFAKEVVDSYFGEAMQNGRLL